MDIDVLAIAAVAITVVLFVLLSYLGRKKHLRPSPVCISDRIDTDRFHRNSRSSGNLHSNNHSTVYCSRTSGRDYCTSGSDLKRCRYDAYSNKCDRCGKSSSSCGKIRAAFRQRGL